MLNEISKEIKQGQYPFYVYVLYKPDSTPFYVGKATIRLKSQRIKWHEYEAGLDHPPERKPYWNALKVNTIRKIWREGYQVLYAIDSWHREEEKAFEREKELIAELGRRVVDGGLLTNIAEGGEKEANNQSEETRQQISDSLKKFYQDPEAIKANSERITKYFEENPEARELARQNAIKTGAGDKLIQWMEDHPEEVAKRQEKHGERLKEWYSENPDEAQALANRRNEVLRSEEHRKLMAEKTRNYNKNNPEDHKQRRDKATATLHKTLAEKLAMKWECLGIVRDRLLAAGEIYANTKVSDKSLCRWRARGLIEKYFPTLPNGNVSVDGWRRFRKEIDESQGFDIRVVAV